MRALAYAMDLQLKVREAIKKGGVRVWAGLSSWLEMNPMRCSGTCANEKSDRTLERLHDAREYLLGRGELDPFGCGPGDHAVGADRGDRIKHIFRHNEGPAMKKSGCAGSLGKRK